MGFFTISRLFRVGRFRVGRRMFRVGRYEPNNMVIKYWRMFLVRARDVQLEDKSRRI